MKTVCAWCPMHGREAAILEGERTDPETTHGMCPACRREMIERERAEMKRRATA